MLTFTKELKLHKSKIQSVQWSIDGSFLASGSSDGTIRIISNEEILDENGEDDSQFSRELKGHEGPVNQLAWSPIEPRQLASCSSDKALFVWNTSALTFILKLQFESELINLAWSFDGRKIVCGTKFDVLIFVDALTGAIEAEHKLSYEVNEMKWNERGLWIATGSGMVQQFEYKDNRAILLNSWTGHTANCYTIDVRENWIALGGADASISVWRQLSDNEICCCYTLNSLDWPVRCVSISHDCSYLAGGSEDTHIDIWSMIDGELQQQILTNGALDTISWHPKKHILVYAGDEVDRQGKAEGNVHVVFIDK